MQSAQVHNSQNSGYHGHPPPPPAGYPGGIPQQYKQEPHNGVSGGHPQDMYPYQQPHLQQQQQQQHQQYQQSHLSHPQQPQQPGYPGMHSSMPPRMPPPGQSGILPPLYSSMQAPGMPGMGGPHMPPSLSSQQQMYGAPPQQLGAPVKTERQMSFSAIKGDYKYTLVVEQQPQRARMCGFGDKDRRPITPPPCVRLVITDKNTGEEVDYKGLEGSFFILQVDLWDKEAGREVNIVRASASSPAVSISTATTTSYPPQSERQVFNEYGHPVQQMMYHAEGGTYYAQPGPYGQQMYTPQYVPQPQAAATAMYTRNLIGSLTVNASLLEDTDKKPGYWFVLQDLSVRTEGWFRLKMNFIDVGDPSGAPGLNRAKCPVLASVYSEPFQVYSAKKFPGVIESTPLSKTFASQGIKIPIRKEGKPDKNEDDDE